MFFFLEGINEYILALIVMESECEWVVMGVVVIRLWICFVIISVFLRLVFGSRI